MKAYDESYSKIITGHKYKDKDNDKDNDKDKDKDTDKVPEKPNICYIFEILMIDTSPWSSCSCQSPWSRRVYHRFRIFLSPREDNGLLVMYDKKGTMIIIFEVYQWLSSWPC